jgi:phosphate transport system substrate-binding protein
VRRTSLPRAATLGAVALTVALGLSACGASNEDDPGTGSDNTDGSALSGDLDGAGSSAQEAAVGAWRSGFQTANSGVTINYDPAGSSAGREQLIAGGVQFAGSDSYLSDEELASAEATCGGPAIEYPVYVSPIAIIYNLEGVDNLQLSPETLGAIFAGDITTWDDSAIASENPDADLPSDAITPVHRSDGSGTTANFTDYLSKASGGSWSFDPDDEWPVKGAAAGEGAEGTSGVVAAVQGGKGTIGYADESQAGDLGQAAIKVGDSYNTPSPEAASAILDESTPVPGRDTATDLAIDVNRTSTTEGVYPIVLISYQLVCSTYADQGTADLVKAFGSYVISEEGQNAAASAAGSAPITDDLRTKAQAAIDTITGK